MGRNINDDLNNPNLFQEYQPGCYSYGTNDVGGKVAMGSLTLVGKDDVVRDGKSQGAAGGDMRRGKDHEWGADDGGHLIGARFGGFAGEENLTAQSMNLNRGSYKRMENEWQEHLEAHDKVFVYIETNDQNRPDAYMGYMIYETPDGKRDYDTFYFNNESRYEQEKWEQELEELEREAPTGFENEDGNYYLGIVEPVPPGKSEVEYPTHDFFPEETATEEQNEFLGHAEEPEESAPEEENEFLGHAEEPEELAPEEENEFLGHAAESEAGEQNEFQGYASEAAETDYMGHAGEENMGDGQDSETDYTADCEGEDDGESSEGME